MRKLFLIDANSLIHRTFHALPPLNSLEGKPTNALYGLANILLALFREKPDFLAACFDRPEPTFRKQEFAAYKAQRPKAPDELVYQIVEAHKLFEAFDIKIFEQPGFEADDLIASLTQKFKHEPNLQIIVLTGDRDTFQLIEDDKIIVRILKTGISNTEDYNESLIYERFKIYPYQLVDFKALVGDPSDNIEGIKGIGPKTAQNLLKQYGCLEKILENINFLEDKLKEKLIYSSKQALFYKKLITLKKDLKINIDLNKLKFMPHKEKLIKYFQSLDFKTLIKRLESKNFVFWENLTGLKQTTIF